MDYLNFNKACQRPDGSVYGIEDGKQCRKGTPITLSSAVVIATENAIKRGAKLKDLKKIEDRLKIAGKYPRSDKENLALLKELENFKPQSLREKISELGKNIRQKISNRVKEKVQKGNEIKEKLIEKIKEKKLERKKAKDIRDRLEEAINKARSRGEGLLPGEISKIRKQVLDRHNGKWTNEAKEDLIRTINNTNVARPKANKQLIEYIDKARKIGVSDKEIKKAILDSVKEKGSLRTGSGQYNAIQKIAELYSKKESQLPKRTDGFPDEINLDRLEFVRNLGGTTGATLVRDPITGKEYVRKTGNSPDHIREEFYAEEAYRALGIAVPNSVLYENNGSPVKLSEFIPNTKPIGSLTGKERNDAIAKIKENFAIDAILGNWDSIGIDGENILIDQNGKPWWVDAGGSLRYRGAGDKKKGDQWNDYPTELWSMRTSEQNFYVYGDVSIKDISKQIDRLDKDSVQNALKDLPEPLRKTLEKRIQEAQRISDIYKTMSNDNFNDSYVDEFARHSLGLRNSGLIDKLSEEFTILNSDPYSVDRYKWVDERGNVFDRLRGDKDSLVNEWEDYIISLGGDPKIINSFVSSQANDSWSQNAIGLKYWLANQQNIPLDSHFWLKDQTGETGKIALEYAKDAFQREFLSIYGEEKIRRTFAAFHAFTYEQLQRYSMPNNYKDKGTVGVIRTVHYERLTGHSKGDSNIQLNQGIADSYSMLYPTYIVGNQVIVQEVPHHRAIGMFMQKRPGENSKSGLFLGDKENEILIISGGIPATWVGSRVDYPPEYSIEVESVI